MKSSTKNFNRNFNKFENRETQDSSIYDSEKLKEKILITQLNMDTFKIEPCPMKQPHPQKMCIFYHSENDRRRNGNFYSEQLCDNAGKKKKCKFGDNCKKSHNRVEKMFRPENYKKKFCQYFPEMISNCSYGSFCSFAHSEEEIDLELIHTYVFDIDFYLFHYKTVWCPFNLIPHDKSECIYAHNWQDWRRKPDLYDSVACENWDMKARIDDYVKDGCGKGFDCRKCHGWKELEYHPNIYRTKQCTTEKNCTNREICSYFHNLSEKIVTSEGVRFKAFKYAPRNRVNEQKNSTRDYLKSSIFSLSSNKKRGSDNLGLKIPHVNYNSRHFSFNQASQGLINEEEEEEKFSEFWK